MGEYFLVAACHGSNYIDGGPQAVYKGVRAWSRRTLEKASERVMDVAGDDDDED